MTMSDIWSASHSTPWPHNLILVGETTPITLPFQESLAYVILHSSLSLMKQGMSKHCYSAPVLIGTPRLRPYTDTPDSRLLNQMMQSSFPIPPRHGDLDRQRNGPQPPPWKQLRPLKELTTRTCLQW